MSITVYPNNLAPQLPLSRPLRLTHFKRMIDLAF